MAEVIGSCTEKCEIGVKRLTLPGVVVKDNCPKCQKAFEHDLSHSCLYYPELNAPTSVGFYCEGCEHEWEVAILLTVGVQLYKGE